VVGETGEVLGLERSARFAAAARRRCRDRALANARIEEMDRLSGAIPATAFDGDDDSSAPEIIAHGCV